MNKILVSLLMIGVVLGIAGAGTWAYFSDTGNVNGNTFTTGTLTLKINDLSAPDDEKLPFSVANVKPGDHGQEEAELKNNGSISGDVWVKISNIKNIENGCNAPEIAVPDITCGPGNDQGELGANMNVVIKVGSNTLYTGLVSGLPAGYMHDGSLAPGATKDLSIEWSVPGATGNIIQSDQLTFDINVALVQSPGTP